MRRELIQATNEVVSGVKSMKLYRAMAVRASKTDDAESIYMRWTLSKSALNRLVDQRQRKFRAMSRHARRDGTGFASRLAATTKGAVWATHSFLRYDLLGRQKKRLDAMFEDLGAEAHLVRHKFLMPLKKTVDKILPGNGVEKTVMGHEVMDKLTPVVLPRGWSVSDRQ